MLIVEPGEDGTAAREYLDSRGLHPRTLETFGIGFAPEGWSAMLDQATRLLLLAGCRITPRALKDVIDSAPASPEAVHDLLERNVSGHNMAKAAVEMACWDLSARQQGRPLWQLLGGLPATAAAGIASGVSIGIQDSLDELADRVAIERAAGYQRIKIKIKRGWDIEAVERVRARFGGIPLMADANAAYTLADAAHLARLDPFELMMIEQPLEYDDLADHARLQEQIRTPICLDESIHSVRAAEEAIRLKACRIVNIKPGRVGGHRESIRLHDLCQAHGIPVWHGGMLESGLGRAHNIHLSTLSNFTLPGDVAASRRYFVPDLIEPPIEVSPRGTIAVPDGPGIGVAHVQARIDAATERLAVLEPAAAR